MISAQHGIRDFVNPTQVTSGVHLIPAQTRAEREMCHNQKTLQTNGTISISSLGLALTLTLGTLLILLAPLLETLAQRFCNARYRHWLIDDKLSLQKLVYEGKGVRWSESSDTKIPVTESRQRLSSVLEPVAEGEALMGPSPKAQHESSSPVRRKPVPTVTTREVSEERWKQIRPYQFSAVPISPPEYYRREQNLGE